MRVVVQERAGNALKHLAKAEPLKTPGCRRDDCFPCCSSKPGKCEKNGVGYNIQCETCKRAGKLSLYDGETGCNCYTRGKQHQNALRLKDEENALWKHCLVEHNGIEAEFSMKQTNVFKSCLTRQVNEAVRIEMSTADCIMNSKAEFHQAPPRESCSSDRAPRRAGGWNRPSPASWRRQRKGRKEEGSRQKLANATTFFNTFTFLFLTLCLFQTLSVYA